MSRDAFGGITFAAFSTKNIPVIVAVMISSSFIESSMFLSNQISGISYRVFSPSYLKHTSVVL